MDEEAANLGARCRAPFDALRHQFDLEKDAKNEEQLEFLNTSTR